MIAFNFTLTVIMRTFIMKVFSTRNTINSQFLSRLFDESIDPQQLQNTSDVVNALSHFRQAFIPFLYRTCLIGTDLMNWQCPLQ